MNKLDEAKINLKNSLARLEKIIEERSKTNVLNDISAELQEKINQLEVKLEEYKNVVKEREDEILYLREQNHQLQAQIGFEQEKSTKLQQKNFDVAKKVDEIIFQVKSYIS
jgi:chromosome segregation ATPase